LAEKYLHNYEAKLFFSTERLALPSDVTFYAVYASALNDYV